MKKKILLLDDDHSFPGRHAFSQTMKHFFKQKDLEKLKENLDFLCAAKMDLEDQVAELKEQASNLKYNSAGFLAAKDTAEMELEGMKSQRDGLQSLLKDEKTRALNNINAWKLKYDVTKNEVMNLRSEAVNNEWLARQLLLKTQELAKINKEITILKNETARFKDRTSRLVDENSKYACPNWNLPEIQKCGKCISCQLIEASARILQLEGLVQDNYVKSTKDDLIIETGTHIRQELADFLAASKKESEGYRRQMDSLRYEREALQSKCAIHETTIAKLETENKNITAAAVQASNSRFDEVKHLRTIITFLVRGLNNVIYKGLFARKQEAIDSKALVDDYRKRNNIENIQIYTDETTDEIINY